MFSVDTWKENNSSLPFYDLEEALQGCSAWPYILQWQAIRLVIKFLMGFDVDIE